MMNHRTTLTTAGEEEDGYFGRLPDDLIFNIFGRVNDSKFLTQCLLICKRIASLIPLLTCVIVNIPPPDTKHYLTDQGCSVILYNLVCFHDKLITPDDDQEDEEIARFWSPFNIDKLASFYMREVVEVLHPFSKVKSAIVDYFKFVNDEISPDMRWIVEYSGGGGRKGIIKSCAFFGQIKATNTLESSLKTSILTWVASSFQSASTLHPMVAQMAYNHKSLCNILVTTTSRKGWIHAGEDKIEKLRQAGGGGVNAMRMMTEKEMYMNVKVWCSVNVPNPPEESTVYAFMVVSSFKNIDREVKSATRRFWDDSSYWTGYHDEVIQEGIERNMRKLVETMPCHFEGVVRKGKPLE